MHPAVPVVAERALAILLGLFVFTVLFRGGNMDEIIVASQYTALATVIVASFTWYRIGRRHPLSRGEQALFSGLLLIVVIGAIGLIPVGSDIWLTLPGHQAYAPAVDALRASPFSQHEMALTLDPSATRRGIMVATACLAIAFAASLLGRSMWQRVLGCLAGLAVFQGTVGLVQLGFGGAFILDYVGHTRAAGTFVNKNHFATLLAMALPVLLMRASGQFTFFGDHQASSALSKAWWGFGCVIVVVALVASGSRAGIAAALVSGSLCGWLILRRKQRKLRPTILAAVLLVLLTAGLAWYVGAGRLFASVSPTMLGGGIGSRAAINADTWAGVEAFFPVGAGLGAYATAFQRFQSDNVLGFVEHAHNDYLQLLFEGGIVGAVVLLLFALAAFRAFLSVRDQYEVESRLGPGIACLLGAFAFSVHALFDFPSHIPALAFVVTLLAAAACNPALLAPGARKRPWAPPEGPNTVQLLSSADGENLFAPTTVAGATSAYPPGVLDDVASPEISREKYPPPPAQAGSG